MDDPLIFEFRKDISMYDIPAKLNNPFGADISEIARLAAKEFQEFIRSEYLKWKYDFNTRQGKMFGVLVVQKNNGNYGYIGTVSGKLPGDEDYDKFVPSIFDDSVDNYFFNKGMTELTKICNQIDNAKDPAEINTLKEKRKQHSKGLQKRLFEHYNFLNLAGKEKNLLEIFKESLHGNPPAAAGDCAAPKLLQYAFKHRLKSIALAEFWWGNPIKNNDREHKVFYPACKDKCRPILEYMLEDPDLFDQKDKL